MAPIDPALLEDLLEDDDVRAALAARDVGTIYRLLGRVGVSQRRIAQVTGQSQSEVCEVLKGRQARDMRVFVRIADGLGIPRARMGLSYGAERPDAPSADEDVDEDMKRRALLAARLAAALAEPRIEVGWACYDSGVDGTGYFTRALRLGGLAAQLNRQSATAYAVMGAPDEATRCLTEANGGWEPRHAFQRALWAGRSARSAREKEPQPC